MGEMAGMHTMHDMLHDDAQPMAGGHMHHNAVTAAQELNVASRANAMPTESTPKAEEHAESPHDHMKM